MSRKRLKINKDQLVQEVKAGKTSSELMKRFDFKTIYQLKSYYVDALIEKGEVPAINNRRKPASPTREVTKIHFTPRGSVVIPKEVMESMGYGEGDIFTVRKTQAGVSLLKK